MDFASQGEEQTGAVFNLVACPFVLCSRVRRHAYTKQARLYAEAGARRLAGALISALGGSAGANVVVASGASKSCDD